MDDVDRERIAAVFKGVAHSTRLAALRGVEQGLSMTDVAEQLGVTGGTVQDHFQRLVDANLLYRPEDGPQTYALTPMGEYIIDLLEEHGANLADAAAAYEEAEDAVREEYADVDELPIEESAVDRAVQTAAWDGVRDDVATILDEE